ncbi:MAG: orotate phosphoribosyltransferase [Clostridiaceae bacterium]|nr:orotate phosphoribosyltransferase [Clostridiaceae bacterium]
MLQDELVQNLFTTRAIRVAPADQPFWYTSGALGPYYINTHFLYGGEQEAQVLLSLIDELSPNPLALPGQLAKAVWRQYLTNPIYHRLMDQVVGRLSEGTGDFISGGERRDFFFSVPAALLLDKPHVSIMKDGTAIYSTAGFSAHYLLSDRELVGQTATHLADLVTEASSYTRAWLPAIHRLGAVMPSTLVIIDRDQGGREKLAELGTELLSLVLVSPAFFDCACQSGLISSEQDTQIKQFIENPELYERTFLAEHPNFLKEQLALGGKNRERAQRCLDRGYGSVR